MKPSAIRDSRIDAPIRRLSGATMGTGWTLSLAAPESIENSAIIRALEETFALVIRQMSNWEPASDICHFNRDAGWHSLKPEFFRVLTQALEIARLTDGAYNPALGARMDMLGFGPPAPSSSLNTWRDLKIDAQLLRAFQPGGVALDLSSIAKGYGVDLCAGRLRDLGVASFLIEIGGEFVGQGVKPDGQPWWIELELSDSAPAPGEPPHTDLALVNLAVATSGDFVRRRDGASHLLDGRTGAPVRGALSGVAVTHASCMQADGWATALFALGPEDGLAAAHAQNLAAVFAIRTVSGSRARLSTKAQEMLG